MVYSTRRFVLCLTYVILFLCFSVLLALRLPRLGKRANLSAFCTFVRFVLVWICRVPLPLVVWEGLRFVIMALSGLFSYLFIFDCIYIITLPVTPSKQKKTFWHMPPAYTSPQSKQSLPYPVIKHKGPHIRSIPTLFVPWSGALLWLFLGIQTFICANFYTNEQNICNTVNCFAHMVVPLLIRKCLIGCSLSLSINRKSNVTY